jgi:hypothetical protein
MKINFCLGHPIVLLTIQNSYQLPSTQLIILIIYMLCRQMYTVLCYLTQLLLSNAAQHVSSLYKAHLQGLFRWNYNSYIIGI